MNRAGKPVLPLVLLTACLSAPNPAQEQHDASPADARVDADPACDGDDDGYLVASCAGALPVDCEDEIAAIHPGAYDIPDNEIDEDCLGGDSTDATDIDPVVGSMGVNGINFYNGFVQARLGAAAGYTIDELGGAVFGGPDFLYGGAGRERLFGVHVWEDFFTYETQTVPVPQIRTNGRAGLRVVVPDWQAYDQTQVGMQGTTIYTVHPDGRVHVDHEFEVLVSSGNNFNTAYVSLDPSAVDNVVWTGGGGGSATVGSVTTPPTVFVHNPMNGDPRGYLCGYQSVGGLVVGFGYRVPEDVTRSGPRISEAHEGSASTHWIALQYDFTFSEPVPLGDVRGDFMLYVGGGGVTPCEPVQARVQPWLNPAAVVVTAPGALVTDSEGDEDNDGYVEGGGYYAVNAQQGQTVELTVDTGGGRAAPATSTFSIQGLDLSRVPTVYLDGARLGHGEQYLLHSADGVAWLHLDVPLANGSVLTVRAP